MERRQLPTIKEYLQRQDVQERIQQRTLEARSKATVTISRVTELFSGFTENKLRDWEKRGLLGSERASKQDGRSASGHRQYTPGDLDRLAVINELLDYGYSVGDLQRTPEVIWQIANSVASSQTRSESTKAEHLSIDKRIERMDQEEFWRYFVSQALRLSLTLINEEAPDTIAGLVLPLYKDLRNDPVPTSKNLQTVGESLIGWLEPNHPFRAFLDTAPHFDFESDFRIHQLVVMEANTPKEDSPQDSTLIVVQRKAKPLTLTPLVIETIRNLLTPIYKHIDEWKPCFDYSMRNWVYLSTNFSSNAAPIDAVLNGLANMTIELGGKTESGSDKWNFCCILLPEDTSLPLQQRSLIVRAQSERAPHGLAMRVATPETSGLSLKAFQSGHVIYLPRISSEDPMMAHQNLEKETCSAIAIPISGEDGLSVAVLYIASNETNAFLESHQRLIRMMGRMMEELLLTYQVRQQFPEKLSDILAHPQIVDTSFKDFLSESDFVRDVESLLIELKEGIGEWKEPIRLASLSPDERAARFWEEQRSGEVVSFIVMDINNQSALASKYGDRVARNLSQAVGQRMKRELSSSEKYTSKPIYHIEADRFYMILQGISLAEAQRVGYQLKQSLKSNYQIYARFSSGEQVTLSDNLIDITGITVRIGVTSYSYKKLKELLQRYTYTNAVVQVKILLATGALDSILAREQREDEIITWDPTIWGRGSWSPH